MLLKNIIRLNTSYVKSIKTYITTQRVILQNTKHNIMKKESSGHLYMKNFKESFGYNLHNIRKWKNLTIEAFAEMLDLSPRQINRIESGDNFPSAETICKISLALDLKVKNLFDIEWDDALMYYSTGKYIKPNIRVYKDDNEKSLIKSIMPLTPKKLTINKLVNDQDAVSYLLDFSKMQKIELIIEIFEKKQRDRIIKITPSNQIEIIITNETLNAKINYEKDKNEDYEYILEKLREFSTDKNKLAYFKASIDAIGNKDALNNLKNMIKGIELTQL